MFDFNYCFKLKKKNKKTKSYRHLNGWLHVCAWMCTGWCEIESFKTGLLIKTAAVVQHISMVAAILVNYLGQTATTTMAMRSRTITTSIPERGKLGRKIKFSFKFKLVVQAYLCRQQIPWKHYKLSHYCYIVLLMCVTKAYTFLPKSSIIVLSYS